MKLECGNCKFFFVENVALSDLITEVRPSCHRKAPRIVDERGWGVWPKVEEYYFCGEHQEGKPRIVKSEPREEGS